MTSAPKHHTDLAGNNSGETRDRYRDHTQSRRDVAYAKSLAAMEIDPRSSTVILPLISPSKAMLLARDVL